MGGTGSGRKPLPREAKEQRGTLKKSREGAAPAVTVTRERPPTPAGLSTRAKVVWKAVCDELETNGILARSDALAIESLAVLIGRARDARGPLNAALLKSDAEKAAIWWRIEQQALAAARPMLVQLGLSPSARSSLGMSLTRAQGKAKPEGASSRGAVESGDVEGAIGKSPRLRLVEANRKKTA